MTLDVQALNFRTGSRGDQAFYGFDEKFNTPFNDGRSGYQNEFPLRTSFFNEPSWFGRTFESKGVAPFDSRSGLDLGDGFALDFLVAWLKLKYAKYHSELHLKLQLTSVLGEKIEEKWIQVAGNGFFMDVSGAYDQTSVGISIARRDAMNQALRKSISGSFDSIERALIHVPLMARVDAILKDGTLLLGTGPFSDIQSGVLYEALENPKIRIRVESTNASGSIGKLAFGNLDPVKPGLLLRQVDSNAVEFHSKNFRGLSADPSTPTTAESIQMRPENLSASNELKAAVPDLTRWQAYIKSLAEAIFLPYRISRYFLYNQAYHVQADGRVSSDEYLNDWRKGTWARQIGLTEVGAMGPTVPIVAVIDSGVDYNHPVIHDSLWLNPDSNSDMGRYGWDFVSHDSRPFDDGFHGTQVASVVLSVAPNTKILPLKVFNP